MGAAVEGSDWDFGLLVVHELLPLEQAVLAHQKMDAGEVFGRIVLVPSGS